MNATRQESQPLILGLHVCRQHSMRGSVMEITECRAADNVILTLKQPMNARRTRLLCGYLRQINPPAEYLILVEEWTAQAHYVQFNQITGCVRMTKKLRPRPA